MSPARPSLHAQALALLALSAALCLLGAAGVEAAPSRAPPPLAAVPAGLPSALGDGSVGDWRICDEGVFAVTGGEAEPANAHAGEEIAFTVHGTLDRNVSAGTLEVWVDYLGFHVYSRKGDLCHSLAVECPLAAGEQALVFRQHLPKAAPPGPYLGVLQATAEHGTLLFCVDINFRISLMDGAAVAAA